MTRSLAAAAVLSFLAAPAASAPLRAPSALHALPGDGTVQLVWDGVARAKGYFVYLSEDNETYEKLNRVPISQARFVVDGLDNGKKYLFRVTAADETGLEGTPAMVEGIPGNATPVPEVLVPQAATAEAGDSGPRDTHAGGRMVGTLWFRTKRADVQTIRLLVDGREAARIEDDGDHMFEVPAGNHRLELKSGLMGTMWRGMYKIGAGQVRSAILSSFASQYDVEFVDGPLPPERKQRD